MRLKYAIAALAALPAAILFGACQGDTTVNSQPADQSGITVTGHGEVEAPSDTAFLDIGIQVTAANVADARDQAAKAADAVISAIKKNSVDEKDIKTIGLSIQPQYQYSNDKEPKITGYTVSNTVEARIRKLENVSKIVDDGTAAGGDTTRLNSIRFAIDDDSKLLSQAREAAMNPRRGFSGPQIFPQLPVLGRLDKRRVAKLRVLHARDLLRSIPQDRSEGFVRAKRDPLRGKLNHRPRLINRQ